MTFIVVLLQVCSITDEINIVVLLQVCSITDEITYCCSFTGLFNY